MKAPRTIRLWLSAWSVALAGALALTIVPRLSADQSPVALRTTDDPTGQVRTVTTASAAPDNPFFESLGTNGRSCITCHDPQDSWTVTPSHVQARFEADEFDPIFRPVDGATCPSAAISTSADRRAAYRMLLTKGLIRVSMPAPEHADFTVTAIDDPYNCATTADIALFRRPLPSTNLRFLSAVMWDGRESVPGRGLVGDLTSQARDATLGHAQAISAPSDEQLGQIVAYEMGLYTAQSRDNAAGPLDTLGATGGPAPLTTQPFFIGINDPIGLNPTGAPFNPRAFTIFNAWQQLSGTDAVSLARESIARGQEVFNTRSFAITDVPGLTDRVGPVVGTCTTCHDSPNVGNHSVAMALNIGISDESRRTPDLPLYTLDCNDGREVKTTDPGLAMITGRCNDIGKVKGPILRGLAGRAPYFHNGSAATLGDVVNFYDSRFMIGFSAQEKKDLIAFLASL